MSDKGKQLISDFKAKGWQMPNLYERLFEAAENPEDIFYFTKEYLQAFDKGATIFDDALSYISKEQFAALIAISLDILKVRKNENSESVILYASLQFPEQLHNDLELIFELKPNERAYYALYPWRNAVADKIEIFKDKLTSPETSMANKQKIVRCLFQTRNIEAITFAFQYAAGNKLFDSKGNEKYLIACIEDVGFTMRGDSFISYCPSLVKHFSFPANYFRDSRPIHINREQHPTWKIQPLDKTYKFGGLIQDDDKNPFIHIITFDAIPAGISITELKQLVLGVHVRELNQSIAVFYKHDENGNPAKIETGAEELTEIYLDYAIKETQVSFADTPERWKFQDWGASNSRENLFRLGGEPTWIQGPEVPVCPICNEKMDFLMQLDSDLPDVQGGELMFGSGGGCYVFWCDKTKVSSYVMQCT